MPIRGFRFAFRPPRISAPRMKLNDQLAPTQAFFSEKSSYQ
jgi:hypothetical protein